MQTYQSWEGRMQRVGMVVIEEVCRAVKSMPGGVRRDNSGVNTLRAKNWDLVLPSVNHGDESAQGMYKHCHSEHMTKDTTPKHQI